MRLLFFFLLLYCSFKAMAEKNLLIKKPLADFIMASLEKDQLREGFVTFLQAGITLPDNLNIAFVEDKLQKEHLKRAGRRVLTQEELARISRFMTDTAMYEQYAAIGQGYVATVCPSWSNPEYDAVIEFKGALGGTVLICLSTTHHHYTFIYADYGSIVYLANTCFNSIAYLSLSGLLQEMKKN